MRRDLISYLREVPDPRRQAGGRHPLAETLCMVVMGMMSGCCAYRELGRFMHHNCQERVAYLGLSKARVPSYVTIRDILQRLDFEALSHAFGRWSGQYADWSGQWLSVDGKSLRSTVSGYDTAEQNFVVLVSAFCQRTGLVQQAVRLENAKGSEIASARQLIARLEGKGLLLTLDALHCQKKRPPSSRPPGTPT